MAESNGFDMVAFQNMMRAWIDELSIKQADKMKELNQNINKQTESIKELKQDNSQFRQELKQENVQLKGELNQNINKQTEEMCIRDRR